MVVGLDLFSTNYLLQYPQYFYEVNKFGNIPFLQLSIFPIFLLVYSYGVKKGVVKKVNEKILLGIALIPVIAVVNNLFLVVRML
jgi:hypothetical protein